MENNRKNKIHQYIDQIQDEIALQMLEEAAASYATKQQDILDMLTPEQLQRLNESIKQLEEGKGISNEDVSKRIRAWVTNHTK